MREIERIYKAYLEEIESSPEEEIKNFNVKLDKNTKERIMKLFRKPIKEIKKEQPDIEEGNIYLMFEGHIPVYFVVFEKLDELYEVFKMSKWIELSAQNDIITKINDEWFIVEPWNSFYLTEDKITSSIFYGKLPEEDLEILENFVSGKIKELPEGKRGILALSENTYQIKFHERESEIVRKYKFRIFVEFEKENVIELPPAREKEIKLKLVAGREKKVSRGENFIIQADKENNLFKVIFPSSLQGKKAVLKVFDKAYNIDELPEEIYIKVKEKVENVDIEELAKNIELKIEE